ncbi:MAG: M48 family metallopeptidase [Candidatus Nanopelagicaceae bacterium]|nr:M48 family metallopeptidase [Candidatus Nanopelagicaceae bacterium]
MYSSESGELLSENDARITKPLVDTSLTDSPTLPGVDQGEIVVIRSKRRKKNISAYRQGGQIVVSIPARMSKADERSIVPEMVERIRSAEADRTPSESVLIDRTVALIQAYAPEITERPASIDWRQMRERWGSCTGIDRTIRISDRLRFAPAYVQDYVLFHEAIHLRFFDHGPDFQRILAAYPDGEKAQAYLDGYELAESDWAPPKG